MFIFEKIARCVFVFPYLLLKYVLYFPRINIRYPFCSDSGLTVRVARGGMLTLGRGCVFRKRVSITITGGQLALGKDVFLNDDCSFNCSLRIVVGDGVLFGQNVKVYDHNHEFDEQFLVSRSRLRSEPIIIGHGCWIGSASVLLPGTILSDRVVIAAGSIVATEIRAPGVYAVRGAEVKKIR